MKDFVIRNRKTLTVVVIVIVMAIVLAGVGGVLLWNACKTTPIDLQYDATKLDRKDNEVGSVQIHIRGNYRDYLFKEDRLELKVDSFDGLENIHTGEETNYVYYPEYHQGYIQMDVRNAAGGNSETVVLFFDDEFENIILQRRGDVRYVGSVSGQSSVQECVAYFEKASEEIDFLVSTVVDMKLDTVELNKNGEVIREKQLHITGYYKNYLFKDDPIYLEIEPFGDFTICNTAVGAELELIEMQQHNVVWGIIHFTTLTSPAKEGGFWLLFTEEFDRFMLINNNKENCYVGSVSGKYTTYEIVEYFNTFWVTGITPPEA